MAKTTPSMLERHLVQMALHNAGVPSLMAADTPGHQHSPAVDNHRGDPNFLSSFSRHFSTLRKRLGHGDAQARPSGISKLPPEILGAIFRELRDAVDPTYQHVAYEFSLRRCLKWFTVTAVCYKWRLTALCDPFLWTTIPLGANKHLVDMFFERSIACPLRILFTPDALAEHQDIVGDNSWRIKSFVQVGSRHSSSDVHDECSLPGRDASIEMPMLEEIRAYEDQVRNPISAEFVLAHAHRIRALSVVGWPMLWRFTSCSQLRSLHVQGNVGRYSKEDLLQFIESNPLLEEIVISDCDWMSLATCGRTVEVPCLRRLFLGGGLTEVMILWMALRFPADASVQLCLDTPSERISYGWSSGIITSFLNEISKDVRASPSYRPFYWLRIHGNGCIETGHASNYPHGQPTTYIESPRSIRRSAPRADPRRSAPDPRADTKSSWLAKVDYQQSRNGLSPESMRVLDIIGCLDLSELRILVLELRGGSMSMSLWHQRFRLSPHIEMVRMTCKDFEGFCEALATPIDPYYEVPSLFLPSLNRFSISDPENEILTWRDVQQRLLENLRERARIKPFTLQLWWPYHDARYSSPWGVLKWLRSLAAIDGLDLVHSNRSNIREPSILEKR
ncbi:hypothetical protein PENSPDRAFT_749277 [Peniophora sp. CONT]|nr:hypothetical protein PENSPDRAFT_749277 [Peniophora sp. CONT]